MKMQDQKRLTEMEVHSGWWVMLKKKGSVWIPVGCVSEDDETFYETWYPEFDIILPIPEVGSVPEFSGF